MSIEHNNKPEKEEYNWDNMYSLRLSTLSYHFISVHQAEKILFIGKVINKNTFL
jgi:hypothetical protein